MRLFIGIDLPAILKKQISHSVLSLKTFTKGWETAHDLHITLLFIGEVSELTADTIACQLKEIRFEPFLLQTKAVEFFSRRIMYLGFEHSQNLYNLKEQIYRHFPEHVRPEEKAFVPHITLKRWQRYEYNALENGLHSLPPPRFEFIVNQVALFESRRDEENHKYHVIATSP